LVLDKRPPSFVELQRAFRDYHETQQQEQQQEMEVAAGLASRLQISSSAGGGPLANGQLANGSA
jgi:hypothetical protein